MALHPKKRESYQGKARQTLCKVFRKVAFSHKIGLIFEGTLNMFLFSTIFCNLLSDTGGRPIMGTAF